MQDEPFALDTRQIRRRGRAPIRVYLIISSLFIYIRNIKGVKEYDVGVMECWERKAGAKNVQREVGGKNLGRLDEMIPIPSDKYLIAPERDLFWSRQMLCHFEEC